MTLAEARAQLGLGEAVSDEIVRLAATEAEIEIEDGGNEEPPDLGTLTETMRAVQEAVRLMGENSNDEMRASITSLQESIDTLSTNLAESGTPSMRHSNAIARPAWEDNGDWSRGDYEMAMLMVEATHQMVKAPRIIMSDQFVNAANRNIFEGEEPGPWISDGDGHPVRALQPYSVDRSIFMARASDTAESGNGLEYIGQEFVRDLWTAVRTMDPLVQRVRTIPQTDATTTLPTDGALPEMLFVSESTADAATAYTVSDPTTAKRDLAAKKFTIQQIWSAELNEDSIIAWTPFIRSQLDESVAQHLGSAMYNGDTTNAGTGNINSDDADPADTKHYLAWDGMRHFHLVDDTTQSINQAGPITRASLLQARARLAINSADDIDAAVGNINWGRDAAEMLYIADWDTVLTMHDLEGFRTVDEYGAQATVVTGELGRANGVPVVAPGYASRTEADGKASGTAANNVRGQLTATNPAGWVRGVRRGTEMFFDRIQRTDQFLMELYLRNSFNRFGGSVASGIRNIDVSEYA